MTDQNWTIIDTASGNVIAQVITDGAHPRFRGFPWDGATMAARQTDRQGDPASERFDRQAGLWVDAAAKIDPRLHARIDAEAGQVRLRFITDVPGQAMTYERKVSEARAYLASLPAPASGDPMTATETDTAVTPGVDPLADYPFLVAEAAANDSTLEEAARDIIATFMQWLRIGAAIEHARIRAKRMVARAATRAEKETAALVDWDAVITSA